MESNRDEAEKCLEIAKVHLRSGNREKAKKFLEKSLRLYPLKDASGTCFNFWKRKLMICVWNRPVISLQRKIGLLFLG